MDWEIIRYIGQLILTATVVWFLITVPLQLKEIVDALRTLVIWKTAPPEMREFHQKEMRRRFHDNKQKRMGRDRVGDKHTP